MDTITHVAIIPDGNRRWAKQQSISPSKGHEAGFETLRALLKECKDSGPTILSFYAFSTENFNRSQTEISQLFSLLENVIGKFSHELKDNNIQLRISGFQGGLSSRLQKKLKEATLLCSEGEFILNICLNYGAQEDILQATKTIIQQITEGKILSHKITREYFTSLLWNGDLPPVDLLIRTSGEQRISNFMLWQCAYAEFYFSSKFWPDFTPDDFRQGLEEFQRRHRRYGK